MLTPRPYLSFSQMAKFEMSPDKFVEEYIYEQKQRVSRNMAYGSLLANGLENEEFSGDPFLDLMMSKIPKFERMDLPVEDPKGVEVVFKRHGISQKLRVPTLKDEKGDIPLLAVPDTAKSDFSAFKEYKTSVRKWTQRMADESGQITFYATAIWLLTGKIPKDIELINVQVDYDEDGRLSPTGELWRFPTQRTMVDILKMTSRIRQNWTGIKELCKKELFANETN